MLLLHTSTAVLHLWWAGHWAKWCRMTQLKKNKWKENHLCLFHSTWTLHYVLSPFHLLLMQTSLCMLCFYLTKLIWNATEWTTISEINGKRKGVFLFAFKDEKGRHDTGVIMAKNKTIKSFRCKKLKTTLKTLWTSLYLALPFSMEG